ncbi:MAG: DNA polymerase III subunit gamma/tau [Bacteroidia bacterium]|nr:DNA polymerase III subunit gamma/tau [Bacteroidia bacterium]
MENFIVSARKYRPGTFESVIGQASIITTLKNSIKTKHLAHSYLFCGPRGVGKTTCARIFAKTINCFHITEKAEACNECESCNAFDKSASYNIHELDAASNNSVEDIRNLIDQVRIPPQIGKYSIYIIDEVHMLSSSAFNAFLKTLEEPPLHAIFILATTEKHKVLPTIISRCQIFDFNRIKVNDIVSYLAFVAKNEDIIIEHDAMNIIALKADGSMRDALSMFDQIVSFAGNNITYKNVIDNLNVLDYKFYFQLTQAFLHENISEALLTFDEILNEGYDGQSLISGLSCHFRDLLVCKDKDTLPLLEVGETIKDKYFEQSLACPVQFLFNALEICNEHDLNYKVSLNKRLHIELALLKLCNIKKRLQPDSIRQEQSDKGSFQPSVSPEATISRRLPGTEHKTGTPEADKSYKSTISIKDTLQYTSTTSKKSEKDIPVVNEPSVIENYSKNINFFSATDLLQRWDEFASTIKEQPRLYNTLINNKPVLKDNYLIELSLNNHSQEDALKEIKEKLLIYLRNSLNNHKIEINTIVIEPELAKEKMPYTDQEKLNYLIEQNPQVAVLQQRLNLDFDTK